MQGASVFSERGPKTKTLARPAGGAGFSLVEVAIAGAIIVVGILALISLFPVSSANLVASASTTGAVGLGAQQIETMRNLPFPPLNTTGNDTQPLGGITYTRTWTVMVCDKNGTQPGPPGCPAQALQPTLPNRWAQITVTITWPGQRNAIGFTTILAE
jgi:Tfp pilus assembly protein PilV